MSRTRRIAAVIEYPMPPFEPRTMRIVEALARGGYEVHLLVGRQRDEPATESLEHCTLHRAGFPRSRTMRRILNEIRRVTFRHPIWTRDIRRLVTRVGADQLHVHDLPLVASAAAATRRSRLPLLFDMHENYPAAIRIWNPSVGPWKQLVTERYGRLLRHEGWACRRADHVTVVIDEMRDRLLSSHALEPSHVTVVSNTEPESYVRRAGELPADLREWLGDRLMLSYVGHFGHHRGVEVAVEAMALIRDDLPRTALVVVGGPSEFENALRDTAARTGVADAVHFVGWQPEERLPTFVACSDIGVIPHLSNEHTDNTIPNKLFQYMSCGRPVIVSSCPPLARIVRSEDCGVVFSSGSAADLAACVDRLVSDSALRQRMGEAGRAAASAGRWRWERDSEVLLEVVARLTRLARSR